jgi:hypothetical protein
VALCRPACFVPSATVATRRPSTSYTEMAISTSDSEMT